MTIELFNIDCMEYMRDQPDKSFDLAIVDPPYGLKRFENGIKEGDRIKTADNKFNSLVPTQKYFTELFRVSKNQVIWGANNFCLPKSEYFCVWDKMQTVDNFSSAEYAWVSGNGWKKPAKVFRYSIHQNNQDRANKVANIHPTQKPIQLYDWLLTNYAKPGQRILDTHLGSGSSAIAAHYFGVDFVGCEIDEHYFNLAKQRIEQETRQIAMF